MRDDRAHAHHGGYRRGRASGGQGDRAVPGADGRTGALPARAQGAGAGGKGKRGENRRAAPAAAAGGFAATHHETGERAPRRPMSRVALLDVNVLVALFDPDHVHHDVAHDWFADNHTAGWATCPLTENGFIRVGSNPAYGSLLTRPADLFARVREFCRRSDHRFWADAISLNDPAVVDPSFIATHRSITDVYLLALATKHRGHLATFDRGIPLNAVNGATKRHLTVIAPAE